MKLYKLLLMLTTIIMATSCSEELNRPPMVIPECDWEPTMSILDFKKMVWSNDRNYANEVYRTPGGEDVIIRGRVIANDSTSNIYQKVYFQDATGAVCVYVNSKTLANEYKVGEEMFINVTGLFAGRSNNSFQIGAYSLYQGTTVETGRMEEDVFEAHSRVNGFPQISKLDTITLCLNRLNSIAANPDSMMKYEGQLVRFDGVSFEGGGRLTWADAATNTNRTLKDAAGNSVTVRNSGYSTFAEEVMPAGTGSVVAILAYYSNAWQLLVRSPADCIDFDGEMPEETPKPADPEEVATFVAVDGTDLVSGNYYVMTIGNQLATAINSTYSYGRLALADISITDGALQTKMANAIMIQYTDEGYLLIDGYGRYLAMDDDESHKTFQLYNGVQPGCLWSAEAEGNGTWRFTNNVRTGYSIAQEGTYTNVAPTTLTTGVVYPRLYQLVK